MEIIGIKPKEALMQILRRVSYQVAHIDTTEYSPVVFQRLVKLQKYAALLAANCEPAVALQTLDLAKSTYHRWHKAYRLYGLSGLENASKRPNQVRQPTWTREVEQRILQLRQQHPLYGKSKLAVIYRRQYQTVVSVSTIGRILSKLLQQSKIMPVNLVCGKKIPKRRIFNGYAQRWKKDLQGVSPGEMVQMDHMTVNIPGQGIIKSFSAICPYTKTAVVDFYDRATSGNAAKFLQHAIDSFPFPIKSIQVDGGTEFMDLYEAACEARQIPLFVLPPRSPENNGHVERLNETFRYECYGQYSGPPAQENLRRYLQKYLQEYNTYRPHQGLGHLTPQEFYELIKAEA